MSDSHLPFFLRLPFRARQRIYFELGLLLDYALELNYNVAGEWCSRTETFYDRQDRLQWEDRIPNQLFYVSRAVSEDARTTFYGENVIVFDYRAQGPGLPILNNLSPGVLRSLRSVTIDLSERYSSDDPDVPCMTTILRRDGQLSKASGPLCDWLHACECLAVHIKHDDQLALQLICDAATKENVAAFLDPLYKLPRLRDLSIRLGPRLNPDLQHMVMTTIRQKTQFQLYGLPPPEPFRLFDLPVELQLRILEFSDLVTAEEPLCYFRKRNQFICRFCLGSACSNDREPQQGQFCPSLNTAFSTAFPCWRTPHMLFFVSKTMRQLVFPIFYSKNTFEIHFEATNLPSCLELWSTKKSEFLRGFPQYAFPYLRRLRWRFLRTGVEDQFHPDKKETWDWLQSLSYISQTVSAGKLTMELELYTQYGDAPVSEAIEWDYSDRVVQPMTCLRGLLKDLFIHICRPYVWQQTLAQKQLRAAKEQSLEKSVMGDNYDSFARGKDCTEKCFWI